MLTWRQQWRDDSVAVPAGDHMCESICDGEARWAEGFAKGPLHHGETHGDQLPTRAVKSFAAGERICAPASFL